MTSQGHPHARFQRALRTGNPMLVRAAAAELGWVGLEDALRVCLVLATSEPDRYEPAAVRWLGRLLLEESGMTLAEAQLSAAALTALPQAGQDLSVLAAFAAFCDARGLVRGAHALKELAERLTP